MNATTQNKRLSIVFFGSGPVAAQSLTHLCDIFEIEAIVTKPRAVGYRGNVPVLDTATNRGIQTYEVSSRQELDGLITSNPFQSDVAILVDFGIIVSQKTINAFPRGIINSHFSLLPKLRGADPITFAILEGQNKTGVSLMLIEPTLDTGKIIGQRGLPINLDETSETLTAKLVQLSNEMLGLYVPRYMSGEVEPRSQPHPARATYTRKLTKADGLMKWTKSAAELEREVRAYSGWPKSYAKLGEIDVIVTRASETETSGKPGTLFVDTNGSLGVYCGRGSLVIEQLKPAGKPSMTSKAFLAGYANRLRGLVN